MKRRNFLKHIKTSTICGLTLPLTGLTSSSNKFKKITILHTNDVHSHIDPFPENDPINPNSGGVVARSNLINFIKKGNPNTLVLDAGDVFQGTPYFNFFEGEVELKLMSKMGYNASTLGNHEFDNGIEKLAKSLKHANFSFLNSNYTFKNTALENKISKYKIFNVDGIKIGVFGLGIELNGLVEKKLYTGINYLDPVEISIDITNELKFNHNCDLIICLSHLGFSYSKDKNIMCDLVLAKKTRNIDLIIGGHTHTFLEKPVQIKNLDDKNVLINQVGCFGINLGKIDFYFSDEKIKESSDNIKV
ncbi:metallophosphatase [Flavobacteriaceae bacterium]|jgi:5'-nucleotidase|nr:bifunctional metallophosphatase/5'-nucleotidase [Flavobacteriaceae bacterium]MBT4297829.1 bifunctional metallophosphatase/5'-nucleotidase [Flavobacteriaceae bacterium]MBT5492947.1 bifunctional metallophosphatase/5'-nucleotidase [Flavobacteriaceae bacterium]MBT6654641.1 bifunctional metallophosphatase/5'-nucleotidase [Flavobacteriaceae bacterium]MBT7573986.1 bifunctional metallophosphatase/5'-nucleotidase [Flavobacteriaceae bacterium]|tara:strand:+ start:10739 stop:11650 length:912 start_codon:yes stop_codon:yes gene_type:complete